MPKKRRSCRAILKAHLWRELPIRTPARVKGEDGYRLLKRCLRCKTTRPGRFVEIEMAVTEV